MPTGSLLLLLSSWATLSVAHDVCGTYNWDASALRGYCTTAGVAAYRSPACSVFRLCDGSTAATPPLGPNLCATDRQFITLCADLPDLAHCKTFQQAFHTAGDHAACMAAKAFLLNSTSAVQGHMANSCSPGHRMAGCEQCNTTCGTADPLLAYATACTDMIMTGCEPWQAFCGAETPDAAQVLCLPAKQRTLATFPAAPAVGAQSPPFVADPCVLDSTQPSCKGYVYPEAAARADMAKLCGSMPDMPGCAIAEKCEEGHHKVGDKYCAPFVLLATLCHDMPGMKGCEAYKALCSKPGSVVAECTEKAAIPGVPTWSQARKAVFSACDDHPMAGCASCSATDCADPLGSLASICHEMPNMAACKDFWAFCNAAGAEDVAEWCAEDSSKYLPSMLMYFHQRTQELLLWKQWRPMTEGQYAGSVIAIVIMGIVATGLKTLKGMLALRWSHQRAAELGGRAAPVPTSIWLPSGTQAGEISIKSAITGVSLTLDYFNMLIAMTFNVGFFCAVIGGYIAGTLLFSHVLENYGAILHAQRKAQGAKGRRSADDANGAGLPFIVEGGVKGTGGSEGRLTASDEESEEQFRVTVADADCNCVHSA